MKDSYSKECRKSFPLLPLSNSRGQTGDASLEEPPLPLWVLAAHSTTHTKVISHSSPSSPILGKLMPHQSQRVHTCSALMHKHMCTCTHTTLFTVTQMPLPAFGWPPNCRSSFPSVEPQVIPVSHPQSVSPLGWKPPWNQYRNKNPWSLLWSGRRRKYWRMPAFLWRSWYWISRYWCKRNL